VYKNIVFDMKNITLSADEALIEAARAKARAEHSTLNEEFRRWLTDYTDRERQAAEARAVIESLQGCLRTGGRKFTRDEMNER
jgi:hypothetical protein